MVSQVVQDFVHPQYAPLKCHGKENIRVEPTVCNFSQFPLLMLACVKSGGDPKKWLYLWFRFKPTCLQPRPFPKKSR